MVTEDAQIKEGTRFKVICTLHKLSTTYKGKNVPINSSNIFFTRNFSTKIIKHVIINETSAQIEVQETHLNDSGQYYCFVKVGDHYHQNRLVCFMELIVFKTNKFTIIPPPLAPQDLTFRDVSPTSITLTWKNLHRGRSERFKIIQEDTYGNIKKTEINNLVKLFTATNLIPATTYRFSVRSTHLNKSWSKFSNITIVTEPDGKSFFSIFPQ